jgi:hypothetical protein
MDLVRRAAGQPVALRTGWSNSGRKIIEIKNQPRKRYTIITAVSYNKIIHNKTILGSANGEFFLQFMKELANKISNGKTYYIIIDNARIHQNYL